MSRYFWSILSLLGLVVWLVGSYAQPIALPRLAWASLPGVGTLLQMGALGCFLLFVALQLWLLRATLAMRSALTPPPTLPPTPASLRLRLGAELFWTFLPLVMTLGLAWLGYQTWLSVPTL